MKRPYDHPTTRNRLLSAAWRADDRLLPMVANALSERVENALWLPLTLVSRATCRHVKEELDSIPEAGQPVNASE